MTKSTRPSAKCGAVIAFRDYVADGEGPCSAAICAAGPGLANVNGIAAQGGGDIPDDGLEALAYAIRSVDREGSRSGTSS